MKYLVRYFQRTLIGVAFFLAAASAQAQTKPAPSPEQEDVIRVNTELVQTDIMVFDKKGHFVDGLKPEQFALKVDNKPQPIAFFERVGSGSLADKMSQANTGAPVTTPATANRGRVVIFFV